jgi:hypothetical protein
MKPRPAGGAVQIRLRTTGFTRLTLLSETSERLRLLGGTITLYCSPMEGTEIVAEVPLAHTTAPEHFAPTVGNPMNRGRHE